MCQSVPFLSVTNKRNISVYDYFMRSQQISRTGNQDYRGGGGYHQHKIIVAATHQQSAEQSQKTLGLLVRTLRGHLQVRQTAYKVLVRSAIILPTLYSTVERNYRGRRHRIYCRSVLDSRHPSHHTC